MRKTEVRVERMDAFFKRGRAFAKAADEGDAIPSSRVVAFEDVESLHRYEAEVHAKGARYMLRTQGKVKRRIG